MLGWFLIFCIPLPFVVFMLNPTLIDGLKNEDLTDEGLALKKKEMLLNGQEVQIETTHTPKLSIKEYLFRTRNSILQFILGGILYGGFGCFFYSGYPYLPEYSVHKWLSIVTVLTSMISFAIATLSKPDVLYSPIHKDFIPPELKALKPTDTISNELLYAVKERFGPFWYQFVGKFRYDNTIFFQNTWCKDCQQPRPARSQHCSLCGTCVPRTDHHCWWLNTHIGQGNYYIFFTMLVIHSWLVTYGSWVMLIVMNSISEAYSLDRQLNMALGFDHHTNFYSPLNFFTYYFYKHQSLALKFPILWTIFCLIWFLSIPVVLFTCYHIRLVLFNITSNEDIRRSHVRNWLQWTFLGDELEQRMYDNDVKTFQMGTKKERDEFLDTIGKIDDFLADGRKDHAETDQKGINDDGEVVGCVPTVPTSNSKECCDGQSCGKNQAGKNVKKEVRIPFPLLLNPSSTPRYTPTIDELYMQDIVQRQNRPKSHHGWFEPEQSPWISPTKGSDGTTNTLPASPAPEFWVREYFKYALQQNVYDRGFWENTKEAFGCGSTPQCDEFDEYDLKTLIQMRCDWEVELKRMEGENQESKKTK
jgi:palmitoyltransferase